MFFAVSGREISGGPEELFDNASNGLLELTDSVETYETSLGNEPKKSPCIPTRESQVSTQNSGPTNFSLPLAVLKSNDHFCVSRNSRSNP